MLSNRGAEEDCDTAFFIVSLNKIGENVTYAIQLLFCLNFDGKSRILKILHTTLQSLFLSKCLKFEKLKPGKGFFTCRVFRIIPHFIL